MRKSIKLLAIVLAFCVFTMSLPIMASSETDVLLENDFEDGSYIGWDLGDSATIVTKNNNKELIKIAPGKIQSTANFDSFVFNAKFKFNEIEGVIDLGFNSNGSQLDNYHAIIRGTQWPTVQLTKAVNGNPVQGLPDIADYTAVSVGQWFDVKVVFDGGLISVFIDSRLCVSYNDPSPLPSKKIEFDSNKVFSVDNIRITRVPLNYMPPVITIGAYDGVTPTNQDITVTASTDKGTLNATSYTFTQNGSFQFVATDEAGNIARKTVTIYNIDKTAPVITIGDYITAPTNQDITVTASASEGTLNAASHTFTENGSFDFIATDAVGNVAVSTVTITNIDKVAPVITLGDYTTSPTNQDITVTATANEGTLNAASHTFTENSSFNFIAYDEAGNVTVKAVTISNIDKVAPVITISDYNTAPTNQDIVVTATANEGTLNAASHTFTANGSFNFVATDEAGNVTTETVSVTNIDKVAPVITIGDYNTAPTNQDITVTATANEGTLNAASFTFSENGNFDFVATDAAGNVTIVTVAITNIDKIAPGITIGEYNTAQTNQDITVVASTDEGTLNAQSHTFTENGSFDFVATDAAGNVTTVTVTITNIDKVAPVVTIGEFDGVTPTNDDITVTATTNEGSLNVSSYTFTENGSFDFTATDDAGNVTTVTVAITNIDKVAPVITLDGYNTAPTNQDVVVNASVNEGTLNAASHTFTANGSFQFVATDAAGNTSTVTVAITNIDKVAPVITIGDYNTAPTNQDVVVTATTNEGTLNAASNTFTENGDFNFIAVDEAGNATVVTVSITNIDKVAPIITVDPYDGVTPTVGSIAVTAHTNEGTLNYVGYIFIENGSFDFIATDAAGNVTVVTVTITNIVTQLVDFSPYIVEDGIIKGLADHLTVGTFLSNISMAEGVSVKILDANGVEKPTTAFLGTGSTIEVYVNDTELAEYYNAMLRGDCSGDGRIDGTDILTINRYISGMTELQGVYLIAANANADPYGNVDGTDTLLIRRFILGTATINQTA